MTEQQIKRIQEAANTPDTAIQCETKEEARMLFEAMGWEWKETNTPWCGGDRAYCKDSYWPCGWDRQYTVTLGKKSIIPFSTLLTEPCGLVKAFHAVGLDWMEEGVEFTWEKNPDSIYRIFDGVRYYQYGGKWNNTGNERDLACMLNNPHEIHPVRVWGEDSTERAKALLECGLESLRRTVGICGGLYVSDGVNEAKLLSRLFPELKPGEYVKLADIVGG